MPDFFRGNCDNPNGYCNITGIKPCKSISTAIRFGIIDDLTEGDQPAFIQEYQEDDWDVIVNKKSENRYEVTFKAIDKCLEFPEPINPNEENSRCDGMLTFDDYLIFVEIKYRTDSEYSAKAKKQLSRTIHVFNESHGLADYRIRRAYISNRAKPQAPEFSLTETEKFADENLGFDLYRTAQIDLP